jgi:hypothetical protein
MSRMYKGLYVYAWDLADEGLETVLGRIRPTGINTLTLAASYHAGKFLRPHGVGGKVYFPADGTVYFQARPERYGHIRPLVNPLVGEFDAFARLEQEAPDLARVAWVVCCHNTPLGQQHPEFTSRNAFGDPYPYSLCPAHPAVRDYVVNLVADLVDRHDLAGVALETPGWLPYDHGFHHEFALVPLDRFAKSLLALCFAESTRSAARAAGIDADRLQAKTKDLLERWLGAELALPEALATEWWLAEVVSDPEFATFLQWRCRVVADLVAAVKAAVPAPTKVAVIPTVQRPPAAAWLEGSDLALLAGVADALEVPLYQPSAEEAYLSAWDTRRRAGAEADLHFILRPSFPDLANGAETAAAVRRLQPLRPAGIAFYNYGHLRLTSFDHVGAALAALAQAPEP